MAKYSQFNFNFNRHRNGSVGLWRLPHFTNVHPGSNKCTMFLLSHCQSSLGSKSSGVCQLWELQDATDVPVWSTLCEVCCLQFCHFNWGLNKHHRTEVQQLTFSQALEVCHYRFHKFGFGYYHIYDDAIIIQ
uniref:Uncharacterized protein n=1 Tax=Rhizophora mucronata TaxID=61149 RepID=A0A2P2KP38_RHIMU